MKRMLYLVISICLGLGAKQVGAVTKNDQQIKILSSRLHKQEKLVFAVRKQILNLENSIKLGSVRLKQQLETLNKIEDKMFSILKKIKKDQQKLQLAKFHTKKTLKLTILEMLNDKQDVVSLAAKKVMVKNIKRDLFVLQQISLRQQKMKKQVHQIKEHYLSLKQDRVDLAQALNGMELNKVSLANRYMSVSKELDKLKMNYEKLRTYKKVTKKSTARRRVKNSIKLTFMPPVEQFKKLNYGKKGISYHFSQTGEVVAPQTGKIVYTGKLANYGNVIMIEHGEGVKSILLGDFLSRVKKGLAVHQGDVIGDTRLLNKTQGTVYFEVREKNKVQNTVFLLDKKYLKDKNYYKL